MKKFFLKSMGCKVNQIEGQVIEQNLINSGYEKVTDEKEAELFILNSCTVTHKSDNEALYLLRKASSNGATTIITGCVAQTEKETLLQKNYIDSVFGNDEKFDIPKLIENNTSKISKSLIIK